MEPTVADDMKRIVNATVDANLTRRWNYYSGNHPTVYATPKLEQTFRNLVESMIENYCGVAVGSRVSRLAVTGWTGPGAANAEGLWTASRLPQRQDRLFRWALAYGNAWLAVAMDGEPSLSIVPPTRMAGLRDPRDPNVLRVAGIVLPHEKPNGEPSKTKTIHLYYADRSLTYEGDGTDYGRYALTAEAPGLGFVPAVQINPFGDGPVLIDEIRPSQDRINKLVSNKLVAAEFGAFRQRVFFTRQDVDQFDLRNAPDSAIILDPDDGAARVQEMSATDLANYDQSISAEIDNLFTIAALPRHLRVNPGQPPSGEAIKADESPLVEHIYDHQREIGEAMTDLLSRLGIDAEPTWRNPEPRDQLREAQVVREYAAVGAPWQTVAQMFAGWTQDDVAEVQAAPPTGTEPGTELFR